MTCSPPSRAGFRGSCPRLQTAGAGWLFIHQAVLLARAPQALRWRLETFGLYMPSLPTARPWWRVNARALMALLRQLPGYVRWLAEMQALRRGGAPGLWRARTGTDARDWERWLKIAFSDQPSAFKDELEADG